MNLHAVFLRVVRFPLIMAVLVNLLLVIRIQLMRPKEKPTSVGLANVESGPASQGASQAEPTGWPMADEFPPRQPRDTTAIVTGPPNLVWTEPDSSQIVPFQGSVEPLENVDGTLPPDLSTSASQLVAETNESTASDDGGHPRIVMDGTDAQISVTPHAATHLPGPDVNRQECEDCVLAILHVCCPFLTSGSCC